MSEQSNLQPTDLRTGTSSPPDEQQPANSSVWSVIWETVRYVTIAALIIIPVRTFVVQPFVVSGSSMYPTFHNGEYLIVDELSKFVGTYQRGDVVILRYPSDPSKYFIKRIIGLPGETVTIRDGVVSITSATQTTPILLDEPYVKNPKYDNLSRTLDNAEYFVMGDNRAQSSDSRIWGPVPARLMDGKALLRLFPFNTIALHPGSLAEFGGPYEATPTSAHHERCVLSVCF